MRVQDIVQLAEIVIALTVLAAAAGGKLIGLRVADARKALFGATGLGILIAGVLIASASGPASRVGPIVTREALFLSFALLIALVGGCAAGVAKRRQRETGRRSPALIVIALITVVLMVGVLIPFFLRIQEVMGVLNSLGLLQTKRGYEPALDKDCPENLKSLYTAFQQYAQDWDALPPAAGWMNNEELISKVSRNEWLHCPAVSNRRDDKYGYAYNDAVSAKPLGGKHNLGDLPNAAHTPLLYDSTDLSKGAHDAFRSLPKPGRHAERDNVLYLDGHLEAVAPK